MVCIGKLLVGAGLGDLHGDGEIRPLDEMVGATVGLQLNPCEAIGTVVGCLVGCEEGRD